MIDKVEDEQLDDERVFVLLRRPMTLEGRQSRRRQSEDHVEQMDGEEVGHRHRRRRDHFRVVVGELGDQNGRGGGGGERRGG